MKKKMDADTKELLIGALGFALMLIGGYLMMVLGYMMGVA